MNQLRLPRVKHLSITLILLMLGLVLGAVVGYCHFIQKLPRYKAIARLEVVSLTSHFPRPVINGRVDSGSRGDDLVVVRSSKVLRNAIELRKLTQHPKLAGWSAEEILLWLRDPRNNVLDVRMGSIAKYADVIDISVTTNDIKLSGDLVQAIVDGYEVFLKENRNPNDVLAQLNFLLNQFEEAKMTAEPAYLDTIKSIELVINDKIRRLSSGSEAGPITRLEIPMIGSFAGPYLSNYVGLGALSGALTAGALVLLFFLVKVILIIRSSPKKQPQDHQHLSTPHQRTFTV